MTLAKLFCHKKRKIGEKVALFQRYKFLSSSFLHFKINGCLADWLHSTHNWLPFPKKKKVKEKTNDNLNVVIAFFCLVFLSAHHIHTEDRRIVPRRQASNAYQRI